MIDNPQNIKTKISLSPLKKYLKPVGKLVITGKLIITNTNNP